METPTIAIVGSGPAGCYTAQNLRKALPQAQINVFERLVSPFGLVRYGVAPDHQSTKSVQAQFERLFERGSADFYGNVDVGRDITLEELRRTHTAVILATGLYQDRQLGLEGEDRPNVHRSGPITRLFNSHPLETGPFPTIGRSVAVIGGGNVSIDIVRMLAKREADFEGSDVAEHVLDTYTQAPATTIHWICRAPIGRVPMDPAMLSELKSIEGVSLTCRDDLNIGEDGDRTALARAEAIRELNEAGTQPDDRVAIELLLGWETVELSGTDTVNTVQIKQGDRERSIPVDSVITAIGFEFAASDGLGSGPLSPDAEIGRIDAGLFRTGWLRRGSRGTIAENRKCAKTVSAAVATELKDFSGDDKGGIDSLPSEVLSQAVGYSDWQRVAAREQATAAPNRVRRKVRAHEEMVALSKGTNIQDHVE